MSFSKLLRFSFDDPSSITSLGITLMLMLMGFIYYSYYFYLMASSSNSSEPKKEESSSNSSEPEKEESTSSSFKYDVFISFRGEDTCKTFVDHLYQALMDKGIYTYKDDDKKGKTIDNQLIQAIRGSRFSIIVFSQNYASSSWCLDELVEIMDCRKTGERTTLPVFFDVEPIQVRKQSGAVGEAFAKHEKEEAAWKWREALQEAADLAGWGLKNTFDGHEYKFIQIIVDVIFEKSFPLLHLSNKRLRFSSDPQLQQKDKEPKIKKSSLASTSTSNSFAPKIKKSSDEKRFEYEVFLSFRGEDTHKNFVDHLYQALNDKGIYTYKDDEQIQKGEIISNYLIRAIEASKFYIIVFSKNYASSSWCLDELALIMECQKKFTGYTAYPVFYDVEPTEVRKQSGAVKEAFAEHEKKEAAGKYREAMKELASQPVILKGTANGEEYELIQKIVDAISKRLCFSSDPQLQQEDKEPKIKKSSLASTSTSNSFAPKIKKSSDEKRFKYDVFLSFRGEDTRKNFVDHLYHALNDKGIYTYKDDEKIQKGKKISDDLIKAIEDSKFYIIVFSKNYASSSWCLEELVKIMECQKITGHTAYPVFYDVEPTEVRKQSGAVGKAFAKHENEVRKKRSAFGLAFFMKKKKAMLKKWKRALKEAADLAFNGHEAKKWKGALKEAAGLAGLELKNTLDGHEAKFIKKVVHEISLELRSIDFGFDEKLVGMKTRVKNVVSSLEDGINEVRMIGIKGMGGAGKTTLARAVFDHLSADFEAISFVENVREVTNASMFGLKNLQKQVLSDVLNEHVTVNGVNDGKNVMKRRMCGKRVLLVLDDVDHIDQLKALAGDPKWFKPGSIILITTRDEQVLIAHRVNVVRDIILLSEQEAISLFSRYAFGRENPLQGYEELSGKVVRYAAGLPLTVEVLGSFLCGKDKLEWIDAIDRLKRIPLKDTLEKLELSYTSLEDDYKEIYLDIVCMLKGRRKTDAITILESCGFQARNGLKVLEQRSLITVDEDGFLGMHDHIEEMGKNIVRRSHLDEPNKHSRLWINEEIEDILAKDEGTEATRCLKVLDMSTENSRILMKSLGKMKKLRYLEVHFAKYGNWAISDGEVDDTSQLDIPNSLKYLKCERYPFLYLPKTFQANNLVGLQIDWSRMVQLWEEGEEKVLKNLKFLSFDASNMTTFDFKITPNLERLTLSRSPRLVELFMPVSCQKLNYLNISYSKLITFDLGLTPNLETLSLYGSSNFVELHVSVACRNLKSLDLQNSRLRSLDLELIPNLEELSLDGCNELEEINAPAGCMKKVVHLTLSGCALLEKLPKDIGRFECLEMLDVINCTKIEYLPDSICMLKHLKHLNLSYCVLLEKLPEDIG